MLITGWLVLLTLPCGYGLVNTVHFSRTTHAEAAFNISQEVGNISTLTECVSLKENAISFVSFDPQARLCKIGTVDLEYNGTLTTETNLFSGKLCVHWHFLNIVNF